MKRDCRGWLVAAVCAKEAGGLLGLWPTISQDVWRMRSSTLPVYLCSLVAVTGGLLYAGWHLLLEGWSNE